MEPGGGLFLAALPILMQGDPREVVSQLPKGFQFPSPLRERIASGRRMILFYAEEGLPMEEFWELYARMVGIIGIQNLVPVSSPDSILSPVELLRRLRERNALPPDGKREPEPQQDLRSYQQPELDVQPDFGF